uniref:Uncharacterized protein n=1 Tax=Magallana gigas TaxID=29159 RepID=K1PMW7_MAGGI
MDIPLILVQKLYGSKKYSKFFIFRMWIGYGFDAAEFTAVMIQYGFVYASVEWMYVFYVYLGLLVLVAFVMTVIFRIKKIVSKKKVSSCLAYFKLTSIINAAFVFFQLYLQGQRDGMATFLLVVTGIDMSLDFLEMAAGCAALGINSVYPIDNSGQSYED